MMLKDEVCIIISSKDYFTPEQYYKEGTRFPRVHAVSTKDGDTFGRQAQGWGIHVSVKANKKKKT